MLQMYDLFWACYKKDATGHVGYAEYVAAHMKITKATSPDWTEKSALNYAQADWVRDTKSSSLGLNYKDCCDAIFEIADLWTDTISITAYVEFLSKLYLRVTTADFPSALEAKTPDVPISGPPVVPETPTSPGGKQKAAKDSANVICWRPLELIEALTEGVYRSDEDESDYEEDDDSFYSDEDDEDDEDEDNFDEEEEDGGQKIANPKAQAAIMAGEDTLALITTTTTTTTVTTTSFDPESSTHGTDVEALHIRIDQVEVHNFLTVPQTIPFADSGLPSASGSASREPSSPSHGSSKEGSTFGTSPPRSPQFGASPFHVSPHSSSNASPRPDGDHSRSSKPSTTGASPQGPSASPSPRPDVDRLRLGGASPQGPSTKSSPRPADEASEQLRPLMVEVAVPAVGIANDNNDDLAPFGDDDDDGRDDFAEAPMESPSNVAVVSPEDEDASVIDVASRNNMKQVKKVKKELRFQWMEVFKETEKKKHQTDKKYDSISSSLLLLLFFFFSSSFLLLFFFFFSLSAPAVPCHI